MKRVFIRLAAAVLALLLFAVLLAEKQERKESTEGTTSGTYGEAEPVYIHIRSADAVWQRNGEYFVEVVFTTDMVKKLEDMRMVTVFCGEQQSDFFLTADNMDDVHTVFFKEVIQPEVIRVEVRAHQTEEGLLLIREGEGQLCGEAVSPVNGDRVLQLSSADAGAVYKIYRVAELSDLLSGMVVLNRTPTVKERVAYAVSENYITTLVADTHGTATCNFTREGLADGIYMVVGERESFYACLPMVDPSGAFVSSTVRISMKRGNTAPDLQARKFYDFSCGAESDSCFTG